ncbi:zinc finger, CCHC-type containing protein [Tanacetum coccineum]
MNKEFEMSDMGLLSYYLGIEVTQHEDAITLKKSAYTRSVLLKAGMAYCNPSQSPMEHKLELTKDEGGVSVNPTLFRSIIIGLRYLTHTRPDIAYAVGIVSRFMAKPTVNHMQTVKRILRRDGKKTQTQWGNPKPEVFRAGRGMLIGLRGGFRGINGDSYRVRDGDGA